MFEDTDTNEPQETVEQILLDGMKQMIDISNKAQKEHCERMLNIFR